MLFPPRCIPLVFALAAACAAASPPAERAVMRVESPGGELVDVPLTAVSRAPSWYGLVAVIDEESARRLGVPGVVYGHSGAPVYVGGVMVGALRRGLDFYDNELAVGAADVNDLRWWREFALQRFRPSGEERTTLRAGIEAGRLVSCATVWGDLCNGAVGTVTEVDGDVLSMYAHPTSGPEGPWNRVVLDAEVTEFYRQFYTPNASQITTRGERGAPIGRAFFQGTYGLVGIAGSLPPSFEVHVSTAAETVGSLEYHVVINPLLNRELGEVARHASAALELDGAPLVVEVRDVEAERTARFDDLVVALGHVFDRAEDGSRWNVVVRRGEAESDVAASPSSRVRGPGGGPSTARDPALDPPPTATILRARPGQDSLADRSLAESDSERWTVEPDSRRGDLVGRFVTGSGGVSAFVVARVEQPFGTPAVYSGVPRTELTDFLTRRFADLPGLRVDAERIGGEWFHLAGCWGERAQVAPALLVAEWERGWVLLVDEFSRTQPQRLEGTSVLSAPPVVPQRLVGVTGSVTAVCVDGEPIGRAVHDDGVFVVCERVAPSPRGDAVPLVDVTIRSGVEDEPFRTRVLHGAEWNEAFTQALRRELLRQIARSILRVDGSQVRVTITCGESEWSWEEDHVVQDFNFYGDLADRCIRLLSGAAPADARVEWRQFL